MMCCVSVQQHWERVDGNEATREHLMMLLADLKSIRIKAKYSEDTTETRSAKIWLFVFYCILSSV